MGRRRLVLTAVAAIGAVTAVVGLLGLFELAVLPAAPAAAEVLRHEVVDPARAQRVLARQRWLDVAAAFERAGAGADPLYASAGAAAALSAEAATNGWSSPQIPGLVTALAATANPDGGYGLGREWDAFQDGSINPANTSYAATTAGHVGPVLLAGYDAGRVNRYLLTRALDSILDLPRSMNGACIPYSNSPADAAAPCVWNVHFGAASWVRRAALATGYRQADAAVLVSAATGLLAVAPQDPATGYWPYASNVTAPQDLGHQMWTAQSVDDLRGTHDAVTLMAARPLWRAQARALHDTGVASVMIAFALIDCRFAVDPIVLAYAGSTDRGSPYAYRSLAGRARLVASTCFPPTAPSPSAASAASAAPAAAPARRARPAFGLGVRTG